MGKIYAKDKIESELEKMYNFLKTNKTLYILSYGYLIAIAINFFSDISRVGFLELFKSTFSRIEYIVGYVSLLIIIAYKLLLFIFKKYFRNKTIDKRVREIYEKYTDSIFKGHEIEGISWGLGQTVMSCPNLQDGWETKSISFEVDNSLYNLDFLNNYDQLLKDRNLNKEYKKYVQKEFYKEFTTDSDRLMLTKRPVAMTDDNALSIKLKKVKWSQLQFMWNKLLVPENRKKYIKDVFEDGFIKYPNSFCLHLVVITNDNKVLLTEISNNKSNDYPNTWAVSIGEQLYMSAK
jgi:hypothetical protein